MYNERLTKYYRYNNWKVESLKRTQLQVRVKRLNKLSTEDTGLSLKVNKITITTNK